jgi:hypothetical protein
MKVKLRTKIGNAINRNLDFTPDCNEKHFAVTLFFS